MDKQDDTHRPAEESKVQPSVALTELDAIWIGLGAALDWIAMRGQPMDLGRYREREDQAHEVLVATLADMPTELAEKLLRGEKDGEPGPLVPIPAGIWRQTATSDADDAGKPYRLIGTDDDDEWDGAILSARLAGYRKVHIRADFVRDNWPEHERQINPPSVTKAVSRAGLRRLIEWIVAETPSDLKRLTRLEIVKLVNRRTPGASRDAVREIVSELMPVSKRGPHGPRDPDRQQKVQKFGDRLMSAELPN